MDIEVSDLIPPEESDFHVEGKDPGKNYKFVFDREIPRHKRIGYEVSKGKKLKLLCPDGEPNGGGGVTRHAGGGNNDKLILIETSRENYNRIMKARERGNNAKITRSKDELRQALNSQGFSGKEAEPIGEVEHVRT